MNNSSQEKIITSRWRPFFWLSFIYAALQLATALFINILGESTLFYAIPALSLVFFILTIGKLLKLELTASSSVAYIMLAFVFYVLATAFFFTTAVLIGGLGG